MDYKELSTDWFLQAVASVGTNKTNNKKRCQRGYIYEIASGNYRVSSYGNEILAGYEYRINESFLLTPMVGIACNRINGNKYQETGTTNANFLITKKADQKVEAIVGARLASSRNWDDVLVIPEIHGVFRYDMLNRSPKVEVALDGLVNPLVPRTQEVNRALFNMGCGVNMHKGRMEYVITYDGYFANKYIGHQGTLKLRLNF